MKLSQKYLIIRADADSFMGTGHIMRCIALAQEWQNQGGKVIFLSNCKNENLKQRIDNECFQFIPIDKSHPDSCDLRQTRKALEELGKNNLLSEPWIVIDGYHFTPEYHKSLKDDGYKLLVIDDMAHLQHYYADVLLNQNIHASSLKYSCDKDVVKLFGCKYVLLRKEYLEHKLHKQKITNKARRILVTMGGSDPYNVTLIIIKALNKLNESDLEVKIVVGPANLNIISLEKELYPSCFSYEIVSNVNNMTELMAWADLAVSSGGSTCWEMAFMGLPFITIVLADNQEGIAQSLHDLGVSFNLSWYDKLTLEKITRTLSNIMNNTNLRELYSVKGQQLVDGLGAKAVIGAFI